MELIDIITVFVSIVALFLPFFLSSYDKNSKLRKAIYLKELLKTRDDLNQILVKTDIKEQQILYEKLEAMLSDINKEINASKTDMSNTVELLLIGLIACFLIFSSQKIHKGAVGINEGVFTIYVYRWLLSIVLMFFSIVFANFFAKKIKKYSEMKLKKAWYLQYLRIPFFILIYVPAYFIILKILRFLDSYTPLY